MRHRRNFIRFMLIFTICLGIMPALSFVKEPFLNDSFSKTTVLNDLIEPQNVAVIKVLKTYTPQDMQQLIDPSIEMENDSPEGESGYVVCSVIEPIKNTDKQTMCLYYGFDYVESRPLFETGKIYYIAFDEMNYLLQAADVQKAIGYKPENRISIVRAINKQNIIQTHITAPATITVDDLLKWSKETLTERYQKESLYTATISQTSQVYNAGISARPSIAKVYKGDIVLVIDRPYVNYGFPGMYGEPGEERIPCVTVLCDGQEVLIDSSKILRNKDGVIKSRIKSNARLAVVSKSAYVLNSSQKGAKKTGVVRKGEVVAYTSYNKSYVRIQMPNGSYGYFPRSFLKF